MGFIVFLSALSSCLISVMVVGFLERFLKVRSVLLDKGIPLAGGLGVGVSFFAVSWLFNSFLSLPVPPYFAGFFISSGMILSFGLVDDMREMSVFFKFLVQIIATAVLILSGVVTQIIYIGQIGNIFVTFFWMIGITNAFNHLDVMDGLAASTAFIVGTALCVASFLAGDMPTGFILLIMIGAVSGFMLFNLPPARVYLGNAGSHFLGFVLSSLAIVIHYATAEKKTALFAPVLMLGFPILDTVFLIFMRAIKGKSIFKKSDDHLALRFLKMGHSKQKTLFVTCLIALFFVLSGLLLTCVPRVAAYVLVAVVFAGSFILAQTMSRVEI